MSKVVIIGAKRTPIGKFGRSLSGLSAVQLGTVAAKGAIKDSRVKPSQIDQAIFGNVLSAGLGQNPARQIALTAGMADTSTANTVNQVCGSGMKAIRDGQASILLHDAQVALVGGTESMSNAPFLNMKVRNSRHRLGNVTLVDDLERDALLDAFTRKPMGLTAETVAAKYHVGRAAQDRFALASQRKATAAWDRHDFDPEVVPVDTGQCLVSRDECIRRKTDLNQMANLPPVFKKNGTVTAGNASGLSDGASALVLTLQQTADRLGIKPLAKIVGYAEAGCSPRLMGYAPDYAVKKLFRKEKIGMNQIDLVEINEAFAAQTVAVARDLKIPKAKLNVTGGAIALGHPLGDSGARIVVTLIHNLRRLHKHDGLAALCIGGGMGMAMHVRCN